jgi:hypothetical protein
MQYRMARRDTVCVVGHWLNVSGMWWLADWDCVSGQFDGLEGMEMSQPKRGEYICVFCAFCIAISETFITIAITVPQRVTSERWVPFIVIYVLSCRADFPGDRQAGRLTSRPAWQSAGQFSRLASQPA